MNTQRIGKIFAYPKMIPKISVTNDRKTQKILVIGFNEIVHLSSYLYSNKKVDGKFGNNFFVSEFTKDYNKM